MTREQKQALKLMSERNIGAIVTRYGWTWPCQIREDEKYALAVLEVLQ